jgi:hypothetical protein
VSFADEWANAEPLPPLPAHPRCRCTFRSIFRDLDGNVFGTTEEVQGEPPVRQVPEAGVVAQAEQAQASLSEHLDRLQAWNDPDMGLTNATALQLMRSSDPNYLATLAPEIRAYRDSLLPERDYWRSIEFTPELRTRLSQIQPEFEGFFALRYGVEFRSAASPSVNLAFSEAQRASVLDALELYRSIDPRFVVDSPNFRAFQLVANPSFLGAMSNEGYMSYNPILLAKREGHSRLTDGQEGPGDTVVHELGHSISNRYGIPHWDGVKEKLGFGGTWKGPFAVPREEGYFDPMIDRVRVSTYEMTPAQEALWKEWEAIRKGTRKGSPLAGAPDEIRLLVKSYQDEVRYASEKLGMFQGILERIATESTEGITVEQYQEQRNAKEQIDFWTRHQQTFSDRVAEAMATLQADQALDYFPTEYGTTNPWEDIAESFELYLGDPEQLRRKSPKRYEFIKKLLDGKEPPRTSSASASR